MRAPEAFQSISIPRSTRVVGISGGILKLTPGVATPASSTRLMLPWHDFSPQRRPSRHVVGDVGVLSTPVVLLAPEDVAARPPTRPTAGRPRPGGRASWRPDVTRGSCQRKARNLLHVHAILARWYVRRRLPFDEQLRQTSSGPRLRRRTLARRRARASCSPDRASRR